MSLITKPLTFSLCKQLSEQRLEEAKALLSNRKYSGAYYLAGYVIELALKGCYCKKVGKYTFPPERETYNQLYSHNLNDILIVSRTKSAYDKAVITDMRLQIAWEVVKDWSEKTRYQIIKKRDAKPMVEAVEVVLKWIKTLW